MRNILQTIAVAFAMFSAIPVPQPVWTEKNMRYTLCAFPLVGFVCGLLWRGWAALMDYLGGSPLLLAGGLCVIPVLVTGGIHLDGYADTSDALGSCGSPEKKWRCGAWGSPLCWNGVYPDWPSPPFPLQKIPALPTPLPLLRIKRGCAPC